MVSELVVNLFNKVNSAYSKFIENVMSTISIHRSSSSPEIIPDSSLFSRLSSRNQSGRRTTSPAAKAVKKRRFLSVLQGAKKLCPQCNMITSPSDLRRIYMWADSTSRRETASTRPCVENRGMISRGNGRSSTSDPLTATAQSPTALPRSPV